MKRASLPGHRQLDINSFLHVSGSKKEFEHAKTVAERITFIEAKNPETRQMRQGLRLYQHLFPDPDEAEPIDAIRSRLRAMQKIAANPTSFHVILALSENNAVGYTQFNTMPVAEDKACVFWQYGGVADSNYMIRNHGIRESFRRMGIASAFYLLRHGIASEDASDSGRTVVGTICEAELIGQAMNKADILFTKTRLHIHRQMGAMAMMLDMGGNQMITAHMQPRLSPESEPILLHMLFRPLSIEGMDSNTTQTMDLNLARSLAMAYIDNFDREGFDSKDVAEARTILSNRFNSAKRVLLIPPEELPDMVELSRMDPLLKEQTERKFGSLKEHETRLLLALRR